MGEMDVTEIYLWVKYISNYFSIEIIRYKENLNCFKPALYYVLIFTTIALYTRYKLSL